MPECDLCQKETPSPIYNWAVPQASPVIKMIIITRRRRVKIPGNLKIEEFQKISLLGTAYILRKVLSINWIKIPPKPLPWKLVASRRTGQYKQRKKKNNNNDNNNNNNYNNNNKKHPSKHQYRGTPKDQPFGHSPYFTKSTVYQLNNDSPCPPPSPPPQPLPRKLGTRRYKMRKKKMIIVKVNYNNHKNLPESNF